MHHVVMKDDEGDATTKSQQINRYRHSFNVK
jgi:hypothetical protein